MDLTTLLGLIIGFACVITAFLIEGGKIGALFSSSALLIVLGGTVGATTISFGLDNLKNIPALFTIAFKIKKYDLNKLIQQFVAFADQARREGILSLENSLEKIDDELLKTGLQLIIDGIETPVFRDLLENQVAYMEDRHEQGIALFEAAGGYSPTMGIIGTVMGLVHVLSNMSSPESLAPAIAVAFIATLYGIGFANLLWLPIAAKLKAKSSQEILYHSLAVEGLLSIQEKENPNFIREKLVALLSSQSMRNPKGSMKDEAEA
ncbi:MAG: flagellar motor protein [Thermacetogeniaceae bacterium]